MKELHPFVLNGITLQWPHFEFVKVLAYQQLGAGIPSVERGVGAIIGDAAVIVDEAD